MRTLALQGQQVFLRLASAGVEELGEMPRERPGPAAPSIMRRGKGCCVQQDGVITFMTMID